MSLNIHSSPLLEAHLTIQDLPDTQTEQFEQSCAQLGCRALLIELARGAHPLQAMASASVVDARAAQLLAARLQRAGFTVRRIKLETTLDDMRQPACYLEWHGKLIVSAWHDLAQAQAVCAQFGAHLSRNSLRTQTLQRFVTLRIYPAGDHVADVLRLRQQTEALCAALHVQGFEMGKQIFEKCIADSLPALDAGWLQGEDHERFIAAD